MSIIFENNNAVIREPERDPLEITEEIHFEDEMIDQVIKKELEDVDIFAAFPKIVDVKDLLKNSKSTAANNIVVKKVLDKNNYVNKKKKKTKNFSKSILKANNLTLVNNTATASAEDGKQTSLATSSTNKKPAVTVKNLESLLSHTADVKEVSLVPPSKNEVLIPTGSDKSKCYCMRYIELYCSNCDSSFFYRKDVTQCVTCKTLLKLQCKQCLKRYSYLSSVHQYLLQLTKRENLLQDNKKVKFNCVKRMFYICSKCRMNFDSKEDLDKHIQLNHESNPKREERNQEIDKNILHFESTQQVNNNAKTLNTPSQRTKAVSMFEKNDQFLKLICKKCNYSIKEIMTYEYHKAKCRVCDVDMVFDCTMCHKWYVTLRNARKHITSCLSRIGMYSCDYCSYKVVEKSMLMTHISAYHLPAACPYCDEVFINGNLLAQHKAKGSCLPNEANPQKKLKATKEVKTENGDYDVIKVYSKADFAASDDIVEDKIVIDNKNVISTNFDGYIIVDRDPADVLKEITDGATDASDLDRLIDYNCSNCARNSKKKFVHECKPLCYFCRGLLRYRCITCKQIFEKSDEIYEHVNTVCKRQQKLTCLLCSYATISKEALYSHIHAYHTIFKCLKCDANYAGFRILKKHQHRCASRHHTHKRKCHNLHGKEIKMVGTCHNYADNYVNYFKFS